MTTLTIQTTIYQEAERARLLKDIATMQIELAQVQAELARCWARVSANNRHLFTLTFVGGQVVLLEVRGAADHEQARTVACNAIKRCRYAVTEGDQTGGNAHYFYCWCSIEAQAEPRRREQEQMHRRAAYHKSEAQEESFCRE